VDRVQWLPSAPVALQEAYHRAGFTDHDELGVVVQGLSGGIVGANQRAAQIVRMDWDQLMGRTSVDPRWAACSGDGGELSGEQHPAMVALRENAPQVGVVMGVDAADADGGAVFVWLTVDATPLHDATGAVIGVVARFADVTRTHLGDLATARTIRRLRASEAAAVAAEQRFRLLAENAAEVVLQVDASGRCTWASPSVQETLGLSAESVVGRPAAHLIHPDDRLPLGCDRGHECGQDCPFRQGVVRILDSEGRVRFMSCLVRCLPGADGAQDGCLVSMRDVTHDLARREELEYLAAHDPLTGLVNREVALASIGAALRGLRRTDRQIGLLFLDIDWFKDVNDTYGHEAGDRLLVAVGRRLTAALRDTDVVARLGGDEFLVVLPAVREAAVVERRAEAVRTAIARPPERGLPAVTISVGMAMGGAEVEPSQLVREADQALYRAKAAGRDRLSW
jgi:diguanylate cyclase (GGDEF)-like protein/PAS domain S-box-containing protein